MKIDKYTKVCLTVIAFSLFTISIQQFVNSANAYGNGQDVKVTNFETDRSNGDTLYVYCKNCN